MILVSCDYGEMVTDEPDPQPFVLIDQNADAADIIELKRTTGNTTRMAQSIQLDKRYVICALQFRMTRLTSTCTEDDRVRIAIYSKSDTGPDPDDGNLLALYSCQLSEIPVEGDEESWLVTFCNYELELPAGTYWAVIYLYDDGEGGFDEPVNVYYDSSGVQNDSLYAYENDTWNVLPGSGSRMRVYAMKK